MKRKTISFYIFEFDKCQKITRDMAHKVHPKIFRIGTTKAWDPRWFSLSRYRKYLREDLKIREILEKEVERGIIERVEIERLGNKINLIIRTAKPGVLIGKGGQGAEALANKIAKVIKGKEIKIDVEEIRNASTSAVLLASQIAADLERRVPYKSAVKRAIRRVLERKQVKGIKVKVKGRLDGAEIARDETFKYGKMPLQTIRADIDYGESRAYCSYGVVGIKVWLYKGEKI